MWCNWSGLMEWWIGWDLERSERNLIFSASGCLWMAQSKVPAWILKFLEIQKTHLNYGILRSARKKREKQSERQGVHRCSKESLIRLKCVIAANAGRDLRLFFHSSFVQMLYGINHRKSILINSHCILNKYLFLSSVMDIRQHCWGGRCRRSSGGWREWEIKKQTKQKPTSPQCWGHLQKRQKEEKKKKNFLHILHSLLLHSNILPMKPIAEKESCKEVKKNKIKNAFHNVDLDNNWWKEKPSIPLICVCPGLTICAVSAVEKWLIAWHDIRLLGRKT